MIDEEKASGNCIATGVMAYLLDRSHSVEKNDETGNNVVHGASMISSIVLFQVVITQLPASEEPV